MDTLKQLKDAVLLSVNAPEMVKTIDAASIMERNTAQAGTVIDTIPYMRAYATTYALMYSYNRTGSNDDSTYYNKKFIEFSSYGGDCANFASQCMWAGFLEAMILILLQMVGCPWIVKGVLIGTVNLIAYEMATGVMLSCCVIIPKLLRTQEAVKVV
jgi:hypothetical protein